MNSSTVKWLIRILCVSYAQYSLAQGPSIQWQKTIGGNSTEGLFKVIQTTDGGYMLAGYSASGISGEKSDTSRGYEDYWIVKLDAVGNILWDKTYGGDSADFLQTIVPSADGGYLLAGYSVSSISSDKTDTAYGYWDTWIVKIDSIGKKLWDRTYGGSGNYTDGLVSAKQTSDNGYLLWMVSGSGINAIKTDGSRGSSDYWLVKIDSLGNIQWQKVIGGTGIDHILSVIETLDGGYALAGFSWSGIGEDKTTPGFGGFDYWIVKLDASRNIQWQKEYGGNSFEHLMSIQQLPDSSYIIGGFSQSGVSGNKTEPGRGMYDYWTVHTDPQGVILWQKAFGGSAAEENRGGIVPTMDGGYLHVGFSQSGISGEKSEPNRGMDDYWIVKTDANGILQWDKTFGGDSTEFLYTALQASDGGFLLAGWSRSGISGDKTGFNRGGFDYWIIKTTPEPTGISENEQLQNIVTIFPNPFNNNATVRINDDITKGRAFTLVFYDVNGKEVKRIEKITSKETSFSRDNLKNGIYFYTLYNESGSKKTNYSGKIIIQ